MAHLSGGLHLPPSLLRQLRGRANGQQRPQAVQVDDPGSGPIQGRMASLRHSRQRSHPLAAFVAAIGVRVVAVERAGFSVTSWPTYRSRQPWGTSFMVIRWMTVARNE